MSYNSLLQAGIETYHRYADYCDDYSAYVRERDANLEAARRETAAFWRKHPEALAIVAARRQRALAAHAEICKLGDRMRSAGAHTLGELLASVRPSMFFSTAEQRAAHEDAVRCVMTARAAAWQYGEKLSRRSTTREVFAAARAALREI